MADVQVKLGMSKPAPLDDVEEDLIDYDDDPIDQPVDSPTNRDGAPPNTVQNAGIEATGFDAEVENPDFIATGSDIVSERNVSLSEDEGVPDGPGSPETSKEEADGPEIGQAAETHHTTESIVSVSADSSTLPGEENSTFEGPSVHDALDTEKIHDALGISELSENHINGGETPLAAETIEDYSIPEISGSPRSIGDKEVGVTDDEITWEEPLDAREAQQTENPENNPSLSPEQGASDNSSSELVDTQEKDGSDPVEGDDLDFEHDISAEDSHQLVGEDLLEDANMAQTVPLEAISGVFPAITVQYKGDEFPLLSLTSEGFFSDVSVLGETLETLLAGFRAELVNELANDEELVYQVDELGLEYAESSTRDVLCNVTLRQILEIFDLLVKNQDPDSSRALYTYLFTKPSTSKRYESLLESATAGVGLDEVTHLFESPMPQAANAGGHLSIDDELDEMLENYESGSNEEDNGGNEEIEEIDETEDIEDSDQATGRQEKYPQRPDNYTEALDAHYDDAETETPKMPMQSQQCTDSAINPISQHNHAPSEVLEEAAQLFQSHSGSHEEPRSDEHHTRVGYDNGLLSTHDIDAFGSTDDAGLSNNTAENEELVQSSGNVIDIAGEIDATEEHDEIDWLGGAPEDITHSETSGSAPKRGRSDDASNADDEKDAKRIRS